MIAQCVDTNAGTSFLKVRLSTITAVTASNILASGRLHGMSYGMPIPVNPMKEGNGCSISGGLQMITPKLLLYNQFWNAQGEERNNLLLNLLDHISEEQAEQVLYAGLPLVKGRLSDVLKDWRKEKRNKNT
jgi:hypothetical protein